MALGESTARVLSSSMLFGISTPEASGKKRTARPGGAASPERGIKGEEIIVTGSPWACSYWSESRSWEQIRELLE
jgi:hypothetical protein